ncbi:MAG: nuclear transport factor 2 family protein [Bryobacteraceae bacterium]
MNQTLDCAASVKDIYAAFQRGDIPAILEMVDENVQWESWEANYAQRAGVPWLLPRTGKAGVADFFAVVGQMRFHDFRVLNVMACAGQAAGEVAIDVELPNGARFQDEEMHLFTFNEAGKVVRFRHYLDTAKHIEAAAPRD